MRNRLFSLMAILVVAISISSVACDGQGPITPTPPPSVVVPPQPTPAVSFSFIPLDSGMMGMPINELPLWGLRGANTEKVVKEGVFHDSSAAGNPGLRALARIVSPVSMQLGSELSVTQEDVEEFGRLGFAMTLVSTNSAFSAMIGDTGGHTAVTSRSINSSGAIIGARVIFRSLADASRVTILHEFGHVFGFGHYIGSGIMSGSGRNGARYSQEELDNAAMMLRLLPGAVFPSSASMGALFSKPSSGPARIEIVSCDFKH